MGKPLDCVSDNQNWCGAGRMLSIDAAGNFIHVHALHNILYVIKKLGS